MQTTIHLTLIGTQGGHGRCARHHIELGGHRSEQTERTSSYALALMMFVFPDIQPAEGSHVAQFSGPGVLRQETLP